MMRRRRAAHHHHVMTGMVAKAPLSAALRDAPLFVAMKNR